ncbi:MAG: NUDIX hydrolase [Bacilli bacterium]|nr:NUDIX hydrolase [Bacilli bacterium]
MENLKNAIETYIPINVQEENDKKIMLKYIDKFDDVLTRENSLFHFTTSAWIVNKDRTKVLMIYHRIFNSWSFIGGHADGNSNLLEVIKREIYEESGIDNIKLLDNDIFGLSIHIVKPHIKNNKYISSHLHYDIQYLFEALEEIEVKINPDENSDITWIDVDSLLDRVTEEHMISIYQKLINKVKNEDY